MHPKANASDDVRFALSRAVSHAQDALALLQPHSEPTPELAQAVIDAAGELDGFVGAIQLAVARGGPREHPELPWQLMLSCADGALAQAGEGRFEVDPEAVLTAVSEWLPPFVAALTRTLDSPPATPRPSLPRSHPRPRPGRPRR